MVTWGRYIKNCQQLNEALSGQGIQGCLLIGQPWIADWTFPYVWMQGGGLGVDVNTDLAASVGAARPPAFWVSPDDDGRRRQNTECGGLLTAFFVTAELPASRRE